MYVSIDVHILYWCWWNKWWNVHQCYSSLRSGNNTWIPTVTIICMFYAYHCNFSSSVCETVVSSLLHSIFVLNFRFGNFVYKCSDFSQNQRGSVTSRICISGFGSGVNMFYQLPPTNFLHTPVLISSFCPPKA